MTPGPRDPPLRALVDVIRAHNAAVGSLVHRTRHERNHQAAAAAAGPADLGVSRRG